MYNPFTALLAGIIVLGVLTILFFPNRGFLAYIKQSRRNSSRILLEDALKHLHKSERHSGQATLESLAGALSISTSQAANLLIELQQQELVKLHGEYFALTPQGRDYALRILRAHRLLEKYLAENTGYDEPEWHELAEQYEHQLTNEALEDLSFQLGNPTHDPHGDPIPTPEGELVLHGGKPLTDMNVNSQYYIVHMEDEPEVVYAQLVAEGLHTGMQLTLTEISSTRVRFWANGDEHVLAPIVASSISVLAVPQEIPETKENGEPLSSLEQGCEGKVISLSPRLRAAERRRMMDLGILPGTVIQAELVSPGGDPIAYRVRGALIALRKEQTRFIEITPSAN